MKKLISILVVAACTLNLLACGSLSDVEDTAGAAGSGGDATQTSDAGGAGENGGASGETFKVGAFLQLTGGTSVGGMEANHSLDVAVAEINKAGGFNGQQVELVVSDTQGSPEEAVKIVNKFLGDGTYDAIIGSVNSAECLAALQYASDAGIISFGLGTSNSWMEPGWEYVFRATMNNNLAAPLTAKLVTDMGYTKVGIFTGQDDASVTTTNAFREASEGLGITIVSQEAYDDGDVDYSAQIAKVLSAEPEVVYACTIGNDAGSAVKQIREAGFEGVILLKESFQSFSVDVAGANSKYLAFANPYVTYDSVEECPDELAEMKKYLALYQDMFNELPSTDSGYRGWDTMMSLWEASKIAKSNESDALLEAMTSVKIDGLGGTLDFSDGSHEGYGDSFNCFIYVNTEEKNVLWDTWLKDGGFDAFKAETGM